MSCNRNGSLVLVNVRGDRTYALKLNQLMVRVGVAGGIVVGGHWRARGSSG